MKTSIEHVARFFKLMTVKTFMIATILGVTLTIPSLGNTITAAGNWDNSGIWSGSNIADNISEDVTMNNNLGTITIRNTFSYTVGTVNMGNGNTLTVANGGTLNVGASGNAKNFTTNNSTSINVHGTLIIWGDLIVNNNLTLVVTGTLIVKGNVTMNNGGNLNISGNVTIDGNFTGGNNTAMTVDGTVSVGGNLSVGNGSTIAGGGTVTVAGSCSDGSSTFCGTGPLPVKLLFFKAFAANGRMELAWATASELNFDYFTIERSANGSSFHEIGKVQGHGTTDSRNDYSFQDINPIAGKMYYRLKNVDFDGFTEYSSIVSADFADSKKVNLYPNPIVNGNVNIQFNFVPGQDVQIQIMDLMGKVKDAQVWNGNESQFTIPVSLEPGSYVIKIVTSEFSSVSRVLVR